MKKITTLFCLLIFILNIEAQKITYYDYTNSNLPQSFNTCITLEKNTNYIWIGHSDSGVSVWNGNTFLKYKKSNSGILSDFVNGIFIENNNKWIATDKGISMYNGSTWTNYDTTVHSALKNIYSITKDNAGNIWASGNNVVLKFDGTNWTQIPVNNSTGINWYQHIFHTNGSIYTFSERVNNLLKFNGTSFNLSNVNFGYNSFSKVEDTVFLAISSSGTPKILKIYGDSIVEDSSINLGSSQVYEYTYNKKKKLSYSVDICHTRIKNNFRSNPIGICSTKYVFDTLGDLYLYKRFTKNYIYKIHESYFYIGGSVQLNSCNNQIGAAGVKVIIQPGNAVATTNAQGYWYLDSLPLGTYSVRIDTAGLLWKKSACSPDSIVFNVTDNQTPTIVSGLSATAKRNCAFPRVSIMSPWLRKCNSSVVFVSVANDISASQNIPSGAKVNINLSTYLNIDSASMPFTNLGGGIYEFNIPNLAPGEDTMILIWTIPNCTTTTWGQNICMSAEISPIQQCYIDSLPNFSMSQCNTAYDNTNYLVSSNCAADSVVFTVTNSGTGNSNCPAPMKFLKNGYEWQDTTISLNAGASRIIKFPKLGNSYSVVVGNHPLHPLHTNPIAHSEFCGDSTFWFYGAPNSWYYSGYSNYLYYTCSPIRAAYDPNDKQVVPTGVGALGLIDSSSKLPLTYTIRFQNMGNDTAIKVVIRDSISPHLDILTMENTIQSHNLTDFQILKGGLAQWTFDNIKLPDSTTNKELSKGFLSYTIKQKPNLAYGTQIKNSANIYFDVEAPVKTNTVLNTIGSFKSSFVYDTLCDTFYFKNKKYTISGIYKDSFTNSLGADSIVFYNIIINKSYSDTSKLNKYYGNSYLFEGQSITTSGFYSKKLTRTNGCDSIKNLQISFVSYLKDTLNLSSCKSILYKNKTYHRTGSLIDTLLGTMGDTIRWVNIVVLKKEEKKTLTGCGSVTFNGKTYNTSGTYLDSISSGACDTIYGLTVNLYPIQNTTINKDTFNSYTFKGTVYTTSQILKDTLKTINGCDSFISINLKIKKLIKDSVTLSGCAQVVANGKTYTQNGVFKDTIVTATADTIRTLFITILTSTKDSISATACNDYRFGDSVYTKSGLYNYKFKTTKGCDSVIVLNLKINKVNKTVQRVGTQYISNEPDSAGVSFQWYICNPWRKISGATTRVFTTTTKASFAVEVKNNACADTSDCVSYNSSGIAEESINSLSIYPNPTSSIIQIDFGMYIQEAELSIFNVVGSQVYRQKVNKSVKETIDLSHLPSGSYLLKIRSEQFEKTVKISKF
jgi:hypothetical protein